MIKTLGSDEGGPGALRTAAVRLDELWRRHGRLVLGIAAALMIIAAAHRLTNEYARLLFEQGPTGGRDLRSTHGFVHAWFAGQNVYESRKAIHPPASHVILWPLMSSRSFETVRWIWGATSAVMLAWLVRLVLLETGARTRLERTFVALLPLSLYATSAAIGNGQRVLHILPVLVAGLLLMCRHTGWWSDLTAAALVTLALVSPAVSAPFFWIVLFVPRRLRPALIVIGLYGGLTLLAAAFQDLSALTLLQAWGARGVRGAQHGAASGGYANLHTWLLALGLTGRSASVVFSLGLLAALGLAVYRYRRVAAWVLLGLSAITARFRTYHRLYDDLLILVALVALLRVVWVSADRERVHLSGGLALSAGAIITLTLLGLLAPARWLASPPPWDLLMQTGQILAWVSAGAFLLVVAERERRGHSAAPGHTGPIAEPEGAT